MSWEHHTLQPKVLDVLQLIRQHGPVTQAQLMSQLDMPKTSLHRALEQLLTRGLIRTQGTGQSTGGRKPLLYVINETAGHVFGLDISRTYVHLVLTDLRGDMVAEREFKLEISAPPEPLLSKLGQLMEEMLKAENVVQLIGTGIGIVGLYDRRSQRFIEPLYHPQAAWRHIRLAHFFEERFGVPVLIENGAHTAAWAEYQSLAKIDRLLYVHVGMGLRSAIISDGKLLRAYHGEDAISHLIVDIDGQPCQCGQFGCLITYCSIPAILSRLEAEIKKGRTTCLKWPTTAVDNLQWSEVISALTERDPLCIEILRDAALYFGTGLANMINLVQPQQVVLGGPVIESDPLFFDETVRVAKEKAYGRLRAELRFARARYKRRSIAIGAARLVLDHFFTGKLISAV